MRGPRFSISIVALPLLAALCGCMTTPPESEEWPFQPDPPAEVLLQPGDVVNVRFHYWPELDLEQAVRPDGRIALGLIGPVEAGGKTPDKLQEELVVLYEDKIVDPEITVLVSAFDSRRIYVGGEVMRPGLLTMTGNLTALEAVMEAGGFNNFSAKRRQVVIVREREGVQYAKSIDLRSPLQDAQSQAFYLEPRDIVFVPRSAIDQVDQWVEQYINRVVPRNVHLSLNRNLGSTDVNTRNQSVQFQISP